MEEIWRGIPEFPGYEVSNRGRIRTHDKVSSSSRYEHRKWKDRILKQKVTKDHCCHIDLWKDSKPHSFLVHRLVADAFLERNINTDLTVNHKDGNRLNNNVENLEWVSLRDNIRHGFSAGLYPSCPCILSYGDSALQFVSMAEASRYLGRCSGYISLMMSRGRKAVGVNGKCYEVKRLDTQAQN